MLSGAVWLWLSAGAFAAPNITIPAQDLKAALDEYIRQSGVQLIYNVDDVTGVTSRDVRDASPGAALNRMLQGTGISANRDKSGAVIISRRAERGSALAAAEPPALESVTVTGTRILDSEQFPPPVTATSASNASSLSA